MVWVGNAKDGCVMATIGGGSRCETAPMGLLTDLLITFFNNLLWFSLGGAAILLGEREVQRFHFAVQRGFVNTEFACGGGTVEPVSM